MSELPPRSQSVDFDLRRTVLLLLRVRVQALLWMDDDANETKRWSFGMFLDKIRGVARTLTETEGIKKGDRVILCYPPGTLRPHLLQAVHQLTRFVIVMV